MTIKEDDTQLPPAFLDYAAMEHFHFLERGDLPFQYRLIFNNRRIFHVMQPLPPSLISGKGEIFYTYGGGRGVQEGEGD